jgi:predicted transcriptional regulator
MIDDKWQRGEKRIISIIQKFTTYKNWISFMQLSIEAKIDHQNLTNYIDILIKKGVITEFRGKNKSRLFCISGHHDDIEYNEKFRTFTQKNLLSKEEAYEDLDKIYKLGTDGLYHKY